MSRDGISETLRYTSARYQRSHWPRLRCVFRSVAALRVVVLRCLISKVPTQVRRRGGQFVTTAAGGEVSSVVGAVQQPASDETTVPDATRSKRRDESRCMMTEPRSSPRPRRVCCERRCSRRTLIDGFDRWSRIIVKGVEGRQASWARCNKQR